MDKSLTILSLIIAGYLGVSPTSKLFGSAPNLTQIKVNSGTLDLGNWDGHQPIDLKGKWRQVKGQLKPGSLGPTNEVGTLQDIPHLELFPSGYPKVISTYVKIINIPEGIRLGLKTGRIFNTANAYFVQTEPNHYKGYSKILTLGRVPKGDKDGLPIYSPQSFAEANRTYASVYLLFHIGYSSSFQLPANLDQFGILDSVVLASAHSIQKQKLRHHIKVSFILGLYLTLALYNFSIYLMRPASKGPLALVILSLGLIVRHVGTEGFFNSFVSEFEEFHSRLSGIFISLGPTIAAWGYFWFLRLTYSNFSSKMFFTIISGIFAVGTIVGLFSDFTVNAFLWALLSPFQFAISVYALVVLGKAAIHKKIGSILGSIGMATVMVAHVYDWMLMSSIINSEFYLGHFSWAIFILMQSIIVGRIHAKTQRKTEMQAKEIRRSYEEINRSHQEIEGLNRGLERKIEQRTAEIKSLLEHIPQGVMRIVSEGLVDKSHSSQLLEILNEENISSRSIKELLLDRSDMDDDSKDQCWQSILASVGDSRLNFEFNKDKFPTELKYSYKGNKKVIQLTWNSEEDSQNTVQGILMTLRDITDEAANRKALSEKNKQIEIIAQLVEMGTEKTIQFFGSCNQMLEEVDRLLENDNLDENTIKMIFVNMHTVKGAARAMGFKDMATVFHQTESIFSKMLKQNEDISIEILRLSVKGCRDIYRLYRKINQEVLGREDNFNKVIIERKFLEENFRLLNRLGVNDSLPLDLRKFVRNNFEHIAEAILMELEQVFLDFIPIAEKVAKDLNKPTPTIDLNINNCLLSKDQEIAIRNAFIHIIRNSLDHGIEERETRLEVGKPEAGTIYIEGFENGRLIQVEIQDDGKGLAVKALKEKGLKLGLITEHSGLQEIGEVAFHQGTSTAVMVSEISGRGVGMGAVRSFFKNLGGFVKIVVGDKTDNPDYYKFKIVITLPIMFRKILTAA